MHRFGAALMALFMAGCACRAVGCSNRVEFDLAHDLERGTHYDIEICFDGECLTTRLMVKEKKDWVVAADDRIAIYTDHDQVSLELLGENYDGFHDVSILLTNEEGDVLTDYSGTHELVTTAPNGESCGPICWHLTVNVPAVARSSSVEEAALFSNDR